MSKRNEGTTFLYDVGSNVHTMLCEYCETIEDLEDSNLRNH
jgi:hypothetical protein